MRPWHSKWKWTPLHAGYLETREGRRFLSPWGSSIWRKRLKDSALLYCTSSGNISVVYRTRAHESDGAKQHRFMLDSLRLTCPGNYLFGDLHTRTLYYLLHSASILRVGIVWVDQL